MVRYGGDDGEALLAGGREDGEEFGGHCVVGLVVDDW